MINENYQSLLNRSVAHVLKQGKPSAVIVANDRPYPAEPKKVSCRYREGELSCAAAPFILDYHPRMENRRFSALVQDYPRGTVEALAANNRAFVDELQYLHDGAAMDALSRNLDFITRYKERLADLANSARYSGLISAQQALDYAEQQNNV